MLAQIHVVPAKAGTRPLMTRKTRFWIPAYAGMTREGRFTVRPANLWVDTVIL